MTLAAKTVVDTLAARLVPMVATGGRVFHKRTLRLAEADLPCWRIVAGGESVQPAARGGDNEHALDVVASVYARDVDDLEDVLSALIATGQPLLFAEPVPYGLQLTGIDRDVVEVGEAAAGRYTLNLRATYFVNPRQPETLRSS